MYKGDTCLSYFKDRSTQRPVVKSCFGTGDGYSFLGCQGLEYLMMKDHLLLKHFCLVTSLISFFPSFGNGRCIYFVND